MFAILLLPMKVFHPFCQYLCPLGVIYGWLNRFSFVQIHWNEERCVSCHACEMACPVALSLQEISHSPECFRCGKCVDACPQKRQYFCGKETKTTKAESNNFYVRCQVQLIRLAFFILINIFIS